MRTEKVEIQYRSEAEAWTSLPDSVRCLLHKLSGLLLRKRSRAESFEATERPADSDSEADMNGNV